MTNVKNILYKHFDLENTAKEERLEFAQEIGELVVQKILRRIWIHLDSVKRSIFTELLAKIDSNPNDLNLQNDLFLFLDEHLPNADKIIFEEINDMKSSYLEIRDEVRDLIS